VRSRERSVKREMTIVEALQVIFSSHSNIFRLLFQFLHTKFWKCLFGRAADSLERSVDNPNDCIFVYLLNDG